MTGEILVSTLATLGIDHTTNENITRFVDLFEKWNGSINLSAAKTRQEILSHVIDSLHVVPLIQRGVTVLDVGSGGGFPVVLAAICVPDSAFVSLEPTHKKHAFLRTVARELGLPNLETRAERIEDHLGHEYDVTCSRATFDLDEWLTTGLAHVKPGGLILGFEAAERSDLSHSVERHRYLVDGKSRSIVVARRSG